MNDLIMTLTGAEAGTTTATVFLLTMLSSLFLAVGNVFLARRNDLGWWFYLLGVFAGPLFVALYPGQNDYWLLLGAVPQLIAGAVGLWAFSRSGLRGRYTRRVKNAEFSVAALILFVVLVLVVTLLQFGEAITAPRVLFATLSNPGMITPWINALCTALLTVSVAYLGFGARWAWGTLALAGAGLAALTTLQPIISGSGEPLFALLFGYVLIFITAIYGLIAWGTPVPAAEEDAAEEAEVEASADELDRAAAERAVAAQDAEDSAAAQAAAPSGDEAAEADAAASGTDTPAEAKRD
ncbi:hypothetical protein [Galactobacter valiniphilus]|uniref:hypothetical protein n=1 Tax=Galactobacter valiniphilus TaxID=2676122 RepID=UPI003735A0E0